MKNYLMYGIIGAVVIAAGGWMLLRPTSKTLVPATTDEQNAQVSTMGSGTMADIVGRGGSWKCEVSFKASTGDIKGTTYVASGKVRADFETTIPKMGTMQMHMITDGQNAYNWTSMMKTGFKVAITAPKPQATSTPDKQDFYHQKYEYQCNPWNADMSLFALPADITFNEMGAAAGAPSTPKAPMGPSCSTCDLIPDAGAKTQCRTALKCK